MIFGKTYDQKNGEQRKRIEMLDKQNKFRRKNYQAYLKEEMGKWHSHFPIIPVKLNDGRYIWLWRVFYKKNIELKYKIYYLAKGTMDGYHLTKGDE